MMCYQDRLWCPFWRDCGSAVHCDRPLTDEVVAKARQWWGGDDAPIGQFTEKPGCWVPK